MKRPDSTQRGYTLLELIVVASIVIILALSGVAYIGSRPASGVRGVLDEVEGALIEAQRQAVATGRDVTIGTTGDWDAANPLVMVRGDAQLTLAQWTSVFSAAQGTWPPPMGTLTTTQFSSLGVLFKVNSNGPNLAREHVSAGISVGPALVWWNAAQGTSESITSVAPFNTGGTFAGALDPANQLFSGANNTTFSISGTNKRFNQTFWIPVVNIARGNAVPGGPMGVIFVQANGGTVYKFYNPGTANGDGKWRRI
jgi:prepilin-type N-terminal cleavage/methylation domain-containing protein